MMMGVHGACEEVALGVYAGAAGAGGDEGGEGGCAGCGGVGGVVVVVVGGGGADGDVDVGVAWSAYGRSLVRGREIVNIDNVAAVVVAVAKDGRSGSAARAAEFGAARPGREKRRRRGGGGGGCGS